MANNKVDVGDHGGPFSPKRSQGASSPGNGGERKGGKSRRRQSSPVISMKGSQGLPTRGQRSRTISTGNNAASTSSRSSQQHTSTKHQQQLPMALPRRSPKTNLEHEADNILRQVDPHGSMMADSVEHAPEFPPITQESLAELDMPRIINNPKLRHDVNFDRELHFRPNLDGSKGKQKIESAELYWKALEGELVLCGYVQARKYDADYAEKEAYWEAVLNAKLCRLPKIFKTVGDILKTLVPDHDQQSINDRLDVALIMREIMHGVCDLVDLANWLSKVLKSHCAPMRDELVDHMRKQIVRGATEQQPARLVKGLRQLLNILEAMKLDVANHQIRHMRSILVDNSVEFSKFYNAHRVGQGKVKVVAAKIWLEAARYHLQCNAEEGVEPSYPEALCSALMKSLLFPDYAKYPTTFYLDDERLRALRLDMQTTIYFQICKDVLAQFCGRHAPPQELAKALTALHVTVAAIVGPLGDFEAHRENIAAEIMRIGLILEGRPDVAYDAQLLDTLEERLEIELQYGSAIYERYADILIARMLPKLANSVERDIRLSALQLQDKHLPRQNTTPVASHALAYGAVCTPGVRSLPADPDEDFIRRFTHVIALHWQVWADICYLVPLEELEAAFPDGSCPPPSPTVPVAQAVYAPGHKWLPVGLTVTEVPCGLPTPAPSPRPQSAEDSGEAEMDGAKGAAGEMEPQQSA